MRNLWFIFLFLFISAPRFLWAETKSAIDGKARNAPASAKEPANFVCLNEKNFEFFSNKELFITLSESLSQFEPEVLEYGQKLTAYCVADGQ